MSNVREVLEATNTGSATQGKDYIGSDGDDYIVGEEGAIDTISAGAGNDIIVYDSFDKLVDGGEGFDFLIANGELQDNYQNIEAVIRGADAAGMQSMNALEKLGVTITDGKLDMTAASWQNNWKNAGKNQWTYAGDKKITIEILDTSKVIESYGDSVEPAAFSARSASPRQKTFSQALADGLKNAAPATAPTLKQKASSAINNYMQGLISQ